MAELLEHLDRNPPEPDAAVLLGVLDSDYYRGDGFQLGLSDLVGVLGLDAGRPYESLPAVDLHPDPAERERVVSYLADRDPAAEERIVACMDAAADYHEATTSFVDDLDPRFVPVDGDGTEWYFPVDELRTALERPREEYVAACEVLGAEEPDYVAAQTLRFERRSGDGWEELRIFHDTGSGSTRREREILRIRSVPGASDRPLPAPDPAPMLTMQSYFLMKADECGGLPWEYSNFAAGNTYHRPDDALYIGPSEFSTDFLCEDEVPEEAR